MTDDDTKHHAADAIAIAFGAQPARSSESIMADWVRSADAMMHDMGFGLRGEHPVFIGLDVAAGEDYPGIVPARAFERNIYERDSDPAQPDIPPPHKLHPRTSQLDRLAQSRAAKAAMLARVRR